MRILVTGATGFLNTSLLSEADVAIEAQIIACIRALSPFTEPSLPAFGLFYRERQKLWDGAAGMCLAHAAGLTVMDGAGTERTTIDVALDVAEPLFESTLVAADEVTAQVIMSALR